MNQREYLRLKREIEREYREKLRALETIWDMSGAHRRRNDRSPASEAGEPSQLQTAVRRALGEISGVFTLRTVLHKIKDGRPDLAAAVDARSVSGVLRRLAASGEVQIAQLGRGRRATSYRR